MFLLFTAMFGGQSDGHYFGGQSQPRSPWWMGYDTRPRNQRKSGWF
jgi:hypothetical protein